MSFETICLLVFMGLFISVILIGVGICIGGTYERTSKNIRSTTCDNDNNSNVLHSDVNDNNNRTMGDFYEPIDCGQDLGLDPEAERMINVLQTMYALSCKTEQEALGYGIDCIMLKVKLLKMFEERGI